MNAAVCRRAVFCVPRWLHRRPGSAGGEGRPGGGSGLQPLGAAQGARERGEGEDSIKANYLGELSGAGRSEKGAQGARLGEG